MHDREIAFKVSATEKGIFQEAYRLSRLPVFDLQLLLAPVMPIFELRVNELERMWKARRIKLNFEKIRLFRAGEKEFEIERDGESGDTHPDPAAITPPRRRMIKQQDQLSPTAKARQKKIEETELRRKKRIEKRVALYGRKSIEKPWYDFEQRAISSYRCYQFVKLNPSPDKEPELEKKKASREAYIGVHVIKVSLQDRELIVLALLDSKTMLLSLLPYRVLSAKSIANEIRFFRETLTGLKLPCDVIRFVNPGAPVREGGEHLRQAKLELETQEKSWSIQFDPAYIFHETSFALCLDVSEKKFKVQLAKMLIAYNIGAFRKRTGPFLALRQRISNRKNYMKDEALVRQIKKLLKQ